MSTSDQKARLATNLRILLGCFAIPSLFLAYMVGSMVVKGDFQEVNYFEWVYSAVGMLALYMAVTGKRLF